MKTCPSCGYVNANGAARCGICARDISAVPVVEPPRPRDERGMAAAAAVLAGCALLAAGIFLLQKPAGRPAPSSDDAPFDNAGTLYSLEQMRTLKFLPPADKEKAAALAYSPDEDVAFAAVKLAGDWSRASLSGAEARGWFSVLLSAARGTRGPVSAQAAREAGLEAASGLVPAPYPDELRLTVSSMTASGDKDTRSAGFFLASVCGLGDYAAVMLDALRGDASGRARMYAACALAGLGRREGYDHLVSLVSHRDPELQDDAVSCLAYSRVDGTEPFLRAALAGDNPELAPYARSALKLREQLGIIKK